jgi:Secretion system C-terminal sorting domain/HmuY protein
MKKLSTIFAAFTLVISATVAQTPVISQISSGAGYQQQSFYSLTTDKAVNNSNTAWDIAFSVYGQQDAGIFVNEAGGSSMGVTLPVVELYKAPTNVFADAIKEADIKDRLYNDEQSWAYGAFNSERSLTNPFDYGWATYNTANNVVEGKKVFAIKLRDGKFRKLEIQNLTATKYTFRYANLDGTGEKTATVDKKDFAGKSTLAYFSFASATTVTVEPSSFDFLFTRYSSVVDQNGSGPTPYVVLGILTARGITVAKAEGVDTKTVKAANYTNSYKKNIDVVGHDWKTFNLNANKWELPTDRAYFVKQADGTIWKIVFLDFEGSATGTATFEKTNLGKFTSINNIASSIQYNVFPTVVKEEVSVAFTTAQEEAIQVSIIDMNGRIVSNNKLQTTTGFQVYSMDTNNLESGTYIVRIQTKEGIATRKIVR